MSARPSKNPRPKFKRWPSAAWVGTPHGRELIRCVRLLDDENCRTLSACLSVESEQWEASDLSSDVVAWAIEFWVLLDRVRTLPPELLECVTGYAERLYEAHFPVAKAEDDRVH